MSLAANTIRPDAAVRRLFTRADNPVVRAVARLPAKLRTKLLAAFLAIAALLVLVSLLGVRVLGEANSRSERRYSFAGRPAPGPPRPAGRP